MRLSDEEQDALRVALSALRDMIATTHSDAPIVQEYRRSQSVLQRMHVAEEWSPRKGMEQVAEALRSNRNAAERMLLLMLAEDAMERLDEEAPLKTAARLYLRLAR